MRQTIETNQKFVLRLEDRIYLLMSLYLLPLGLFINAIFHFDPRIGISTPVCLTILGICLLISCLTIFLAYRRRLQDHYYLEDETIIKERNGKEVFRIAFKDVVSVRINDKKGKQGTIIFFTDPRSKNFSFSFFNSISLYNTPIAAYGFTKKKIALIKDRKQLLTAIYRINPELHFIE